MSDFSLMPEEAGGGEMGQCMELIYKLHTGFAGATLCILDRTMLANGLYIASGQILSGRQLMYALHRFLGTVAKMHSRFLKEFGGKD